MATPKEVLLSEISDGIVPIPVQKSTVGKLLSYPRLLSMIHEDGFPALKIGRRWYTTSGAISAWVACQNGLGGLAESPSDIPQDGVNSKPSEPELDMEDFSDDSQIL